jgi:site-specific DNA-methyltransferase (cytosine-N4-specific)
MLTDEGDTVLDIFGGSNTTGFTAEALNRKWQTFELSREYLASSVFRFLEGKSIETVRQALGKLQGDHVNYFVGEAFCELGPVKAPKPKNEVLGQAVLF